MARPTKEESALKIKALDESVDILIEKSTSTKNHLTTPAVVRLANSSEYAESFSTNISLASLKKPKSTDHKRIKKRIEDHKKSFKTTKEIISDATKKKMDALEKQNEDLLLRLAELLDNSIKQKEAIESLNNSLDKVKKDRDACYERLNNAG